MFEKWHQLNLLILIENHYKFYLIKTIKSSKLFAMIGSGFGLLDTAGGPAGAGSKVGLLSRIATIFKPLTDLGKIIAKLPVIAQITKVFGKGGTLLKSLGKLFLPFTIIIGLFDTVKGFYNGFFGKDLVVCNLCLLIYKVLNSLIYF